MTKTNTVELAGSPSPRNQRASVPPAKNLDLAAVVEGDDFREAIIRGLEAGLSPNDMAKKIAKGDRKKHKRLRRRIIYMVQRDERLAAQIMATAKGEAMVGLIPAVKGLSRRAARGRPDAIKPLMAVTGFHDPSVKHEHTGEIKITLEGVPRPKRVSQEEGEVIDAEVVEEE